MPSVTQTRQEKKPGVSLLRLMLSMLCISAFTFGGGFVIVTLMKKKFVDEYGWLDEQEMLDMVALAQSSPGAIAVNAAILVGWRMRGLPGMIVSVFGTILPPMVTLCIVSLFYAAFSSSPLVAAVLRGMQAGVAAVILDVAVNLGGGILRSHSALQTGMMICAFAAAFVFGVNVILIILACAAVGLAVALIRHRKGGRACI